jgi:hypothetical protein
MVSGQILQESRYTHPSLTEHSHDTVNLIAHIPAYEYRLSVGDLRDVQKYLVVLIERGSTLAGGNSLDCGYLTIRTLLVGVLVNCCASSVWTWLTSLILLSVITLKIKWFVISRLCLLSEHAASTEQTQPTFIVGITAYPR